ncbi:MAG: hypothetical protein U9N87_11960, partial [Planctomycetota bacterium]|nr:hypothetical protein [Planctomycetota bacterium]
MRIWGGGKDQDGCATISIPSLDRKFDDAHTWESVSVAIRAWLGGNRQSPGGSSGAWGVFSKSLVLGAFCSSILAAPALVWPPPWPTLAAAGYVFWIAAVWLLLGSLVGRASLVSGAQAALSLAAVLASTAWIESRGLMLDNPISLQAYLLPLAALGLAWAGVRIALRKIPAADRLLNPSWVPVDVALQYAVVCCQFVAAAWWLIVACGGEFFGAAKITAIAKVSDGCGPGAWLVLIVLGGWAVVSLWNRWRDSELAVAIVIALTTPCLIAAAFVDDLASASAARWAMAVCFVVCSLPIWYRRDVARLLKQAGAKLELGPNAARMARAMIVAVAGGAIVGLTVFAAAVELTGSRSVGPAAGTFFESMGSQISYLVPLLFVIGALVGYAVRERSSGYAFMAGLVVEIAVVLGYALSVTLAGRPDFPHFPITLLQLATTTAAVWAGLWLGARRWIAIWREDTTGTPPKMLMNVQLAMAVAGNLLLLCPALAMLSLSSSWFDKWIGAVGLPVGWAALLLTVAVVVWHGIERGRTSGLANFIGIAGLAAVGLLACSVQQYCNVYDLNDNWSYRTLMIGWAMYSLTVVLSTWWASVLLSEDEAEGPPLILVRAASVWVAISGILAVGLGLKAAFVHGDQLWAAMAIALPSMAGAVMAVWQRREWWAFTSALGVNVAASLVVWHVELSTPFEDWWVMLVQANVIASALVALVWLVARTRLKRLRDLAEGAGPLLSTQILMAAAGNCLLLALPVVYMIREPQALPQ